MPHAMKAHGEAEAWLHVFLTSALNCDGYKYKCEVTFWNFQSGCHSYYDLLADDTP